MAALVGLVAECTGLCTPFGYVAVILCILLVPRVLFCQHLGHFCEVFQTLAFVQVYPFDLRLECNQTPATELSGFSRMDSKHIRIRPRFVPCNSEKECRGRVFTDSQGPRTCRFAQMLKWRCVYERIVRPCVVISRQIRVHCSSPVAIQRHHADKHH